MPASNRKLSPLYELYTPENGFIPILAVGGINVSAIAVHDYEIHYDKGGEQERKWELSALDETKKGGRVGNKVIWYGYASLE